MSRVVAVRFLGALSLLASVPTLVHAASPEPTTEAPATPAAPAAPAADHSGSIRGTVSLLAGAVGNVAYDDGMSQVLLGVDIDIRTDLLTFGIGLDANTNFNRSGTQIGLRVGHTFRLAEHLDFDLAGEFGMSLARASGGFLSGDPGIEAWFPFLGARTEFSVVIGPRHAPVTGRVGIGAFARADLGPPHTGDSTFQDCFFSCGEVETATHTVGGDVSIGGMLRLGIEFGN